MLYFLQVAIQPLYQLPGSFLPHCWPSSVRLPHNRQPFTSPHLTLCCPAKLPTPPLPACLPICFLCLPLVTLSCLELLYLHPTCQVSPSQPCSCCLLSQECPPSHLLSRGSCLLSCLSLLPLHLLCRVVHVVLGAASQWSLSTAVSAPVGKLYRTTEESLKQGPIVIVYLVFAGHCSRP
jgi:hypothetical protein